MGSEMCIRDSNVSCESSSSSAPRCSRRFCEALRVSPLIFNCGGSAAVAAANASVAHSSAMARSRWGRAVNICVSGVSNRAVFPVRDGGSSYHRRLREITHCYDSKSVIRLHFGAPSNLQCQEMP